MSASVILAPAQAGLAGMLRARIEGGAPVREVAFADMPLWLFRALDFSRPVQAVFCSKFAALAVYADGSRTLRRAPAA